MVNKRSFVTVKNKKGNKSNETRRENLGDDMFGSSGSDSEEVTNVSIEVGRAEEGRSKKNCKYVTCL